ncbi:MAG: hypothetical protein K0R17_424 [Rariglobus sp.]|jgi:hypothetical protein|nr:hypothetical protein [Rariglobus sp.]
MSIRFRLLLIAPGLSSAIPASAKSLAIVNSGFETDTGIDNSGNAMGLIRSNRRA